MSNKVYDTLKWISLVFLPALISFTGVVLNVLKIENTEVILTIAVAFNTFLGTILGISNINYKKNAFIEGAVEFNELSEQDNDTKGSK